MTLSAAYERGEPPYTEDSEGRSEEGLLELSTDGLGCTVLLVARGRHRLHANE